MPEIGKQLCNHPLVDEIHITGSDRTFNAIVAGGVTKPITAELGNVSPTIVVPGPWTDADFRFQAEQIVTQKLHNDGFNCIASQVLVLPRDWDGTPKLIAQIEAVMREVLDRPAYYPGASERCERLATGHESERYGRSDQGYTPRTIVRVDASSEDPNFEIEAFASVLAVTTLPGDTANLLARRGDIRKRPLVGDARRELSGASSHDEHATQAISMRRSRDCATAASRSMPGPASASY